MAVAANGSVLFEGLAPGEHVALLTGVAANCSVSEPNPQTITMLEGEGAQATFTVTCEPVDPLPPVGSLRIEVTTTGCAPGTDAYTIKVDGTVAGEIPTNGVVTLEDLAVGEHSVRLSGVHGDCRVRGHNPVTVSVEEGTTAHVAFEVICKD